MGNERDHQPVEDVLAARLLVYALLQRGFAAGPDHTFTQAFCASDAQRSVGVVAHGDGGEPVSELEDAYRSCSCLLGEASEAGLNGLCSDYTRLFVGPAALAAPPWESQYRGVGSSLFQETTLAVRREYRQQGFSPDGLARVADDHIALELDFMKHLASEALFRHVEADSGEVSRLLQVQEAFLDEHLLCWADDFAQRVVAEESSLFYAGLARMLVFFLQADRQQLRLRMS